MNFADNDPENWNYTLYIVIKNQTIPISILEFRPRPVVWHQWGRRRLPACRRESDRPEKHSGVVFQPARNARPCQQPLLIPGDGDTRQPRILSQHIYTHFIVKSQNFVENCSFPPLFTRRDFSFQWTTKQNKIFACFVM